MSLDTVRGILIPYILSLTEAISLWLALIKTLFNI